MKVRVDYTVEIPDEYRAALSHSWGFHGQKATREEVRDHLRNVGSTEDDDMQNEWADCEDGCHDAA